jgi:hypothetical protein
MQYLNLINYCELAALCCSFFLLRQRGQNMLRLLIVMLLIICTAEMTGIYYRYVLVRSNHPIFNASTALCIVILLVILRDAIESPGLKPWLAAGIAAYCLFCSANLVFLQGMKRFATYNYIAGGVTLCLYCCIYFRQIIGKPVYLSLSTQPMFWLSSAVILRYVPMSLVYAVFEYLSYKKEISNQFGQTFQLLNTILSIIFYGLICVASTCRLLFRTSITRSS